jgi:hypothetical protein
MESSDSLPGEKRRSFVPPRVEIRQLDFSRHEKPARTEALTNRKGEVARVVKRLLAIVREHRSSARRVGAPIDPTALGMIVNALRIASFGRDPRPLLHHPDPVAAWLRQSLFQDLLEEPGNVLFTTRIDDETIRHEATEVEFWKECLRELAEAVEQG